MNKSGKIVIIILSILLILIGLAVSLYLKIIPTLVSNDKFINFTEKIVKKTTDFELEIQKPILKTDFSPVISFSVDSIVLKNNKEKLIDVNNFQTIVSWKKILKQTLIIKKLGVDYLYIDAAKLEELSKKEEKQEQKKSNWKVDIFDALLYVKNCTVIYNIKKDAKIKLSAKNLEVTSTHNPKFVKFDVTLELAKNQDVFVFKFADKNKVYFKDRTLYIDNNDFYINNSKIIVNLLLHEKQGYKLKLNSNNIDMADVSDLLKTNIIMPNGNEVLSPLKDIGGSFSFNMTLDDKSLDAFVTLKKFYFKSILVNNLPITLTQGKIKINSKDVNIYDVKGYYGNSTSNKLKLKGNVLDYNNGLNLKITALMFATKEFSDNITAIIGYPLEIVGKMFTKVDLQMTDTAMDITALFALKKGDDILVDGTSMTPTKFDRAFKAVLHMANGNLQLKELNYYITKQFKRGVKPQPILQITGNLDANNNMAIKDIGFKITKPLPSEFLNLFMGARVFRKGKIAGNLNYIATDKIPYLLGALSMDEVRVPSQRLKIQQGKLIANKNDILLKVNGKYRRTEYSIDGSIVNEIKLPFVVKTLNLNIADLDIEKILQSMQRQQEFEAQHAGDITKKLASEADIIDADNNDDTTASMFSPGIIVVQNCVLKIVKGLYKEIKFGNVLATMTLDKNGIFELHSNKFDIADGISTANIVCDLVNQKYKMRLGLKDVDTDTIATSLLNLPREISGKARGLILLDTDKSMKLNGLMKFSIVNGNIATVGLIEYALNFVSLFRNPLAMLSPATVFDLVNVPEGKFNKISGTLHLKNNAIERMMIKSSAPQLSSFIVGRYDLEKSDATLRIYTKFSNNKKGAAGVLRNISLNSLAAKVALTSKNDANYYASELAQIPEIEDEKNAQVFLTKIDGDIEHNNFLSILKKIK